MSAGQSNANCIMCPYCREAGLVVELDRRGRPYTYCAQCRTRAFFQQRRALVGLTQLQPAIADLAAVPVPSDELDHTFSELIVSMKSAVNL
jgi:hypothetical protein